MKVGMTRDDEVYNKKEHEHFSETLSDFLDLPNMSSCNDTSISNIAQQYHTRDTVSPFMFT